MMMTNTVRMPTALNETRYQMFEYAIGHWLQKSTEHVMGCVLCSPGES